MSGSSLPATLVGGWLASSWSVSLGFGLATGTPDVRVTDVADPEPTVVVSIVVPMRNERANAAACVTAALAQDHPAVEVVVVDDDSTDGTGHVAADAAAGDPRFLLVPGDPLPGGWVGKPWACHQGALQASGQWLLFVDADVVLHPAAVRTLLAEAAAHQACVVSWIGRQRLETFWERAINPVVFFFIAATNPLPLARRPGSRVVLVNGQFLAFTREAYDEVGGHQAVRGAVVEDLALGRAAKTRFGDGYRFAWARDLLATRMYATLSEIREGWSKNMAVGAAVVGIPAGAMVAGAALGGLGPWVGLGVTALGRSGGEAGGLFAVAAAAQVASLGVLVRRVSGVSGVWGLTAPVGTAAVVAIAAESWWRARRGAVRWRDRNYAARA